MLKFNRLFSVLLVVVIMLSSMSALAVNAQTEEGTSSEMLQNILVTDETEDVLDATADEAVIPEATEDEVGAVELPSYVDNSLSKYFPEIVDNFEYFDDEAIMSPVIATVYYQFTYEMNKLRDVETTNENTFSPLFVYDVINKGIYIPDYMISRFAGIIVFGLRRSADNYTDALEETYNFLMNVGCTTNDLYLYDPMASNSYDRWPGGAKTWRDAYRYRMDGYYTFPEIGDEDTAITSPDDTDLNEIKEALNNGSVLTVDTPVYYYSEKIKTHEDAPENEKFVGMYVARAANDVHDYLDTKVLVGYNDNIWCDVNENGVVDSGEMGAFKIIETLNSDRPYWLAYDALNVTSLVEGAKAERDRVKAITNVKKITVKAPDEDNDIYVKFTLDYGVHSKFAVTFTAEGNGEKYEKRFLPEVNYLVDKDKNRFSHNQFAFLLSDLIPDLTAENFDDYEIYMTVEDMADDGYELRLEDAALVNEFTGEECVILDGKEKIKLENTEYKVKVSGGMYIYYIGYDDPVMYYKTDDGEFREVPMKYTTEEAGYLYKYFLADTSEALVYFADGNGNIDDNNGEYFKAVEGFNYYTTEGLKEPLTIHEFAIANGLPDISSGGYNYKKTKYNVDFSGGYAPYKYRLTYKDLETGTESNTAFYTFDEKTVLEKTWFDEYNALEVTLEIKDQRGDIASKSITFEVKDRPFDLSIVTADKDVYYLSESVDFRIDTEYMAVNNTKKTAPRLDCVVKDSDGNIVFSDRFRDCDEVNLYDMTTTTYLNFMPEKAGEYTLTVSATDDSGAYAEKNITFAVLDKVTGDADGDGVVNIKDATLIQKYISGLATADEINTELADCDADGEITIKDATNIQKYLSLFDDCAGAGQIKEFVYPTYTVKFENTLGWDHVYCEILSPYKALSAGWPGVLMTPCGVNEQGETVYSVQVPYGVTQVAFVNTTNNGAYCEETVRIGFNNKDTVYYGIRNEGITLHEVAEKECN